jgi:dihydrofolate synthase/folylpolyglutamate synthase
MDHEKWLGKTREEIGSQKAAIFKEGKIGILASERMPESVTSLAYKVCSSVFELGKSFIIEENLSGWNYILKENEFDLENLSYRNLNVESAAGAITAFKLISKKEIDYRGVIEKTSLKGRCDVFDNFIFDVSHNPASVKHLVNFLKKKLRTSKF